MKLTVLGNYGPYPKAGGACSGFLIDDGGSKIVLDFGNGVLSRLLHYVDIEEIDAIILSHLHGDHIGDMGILKYAAHIKMQKGLMKEGIPVYAPSEPAEEFERLKYKDAIKLFSINPAEVLRIGNMNIRFKQMEHGYLNFAIMLEKGNKKIVYSGDTSPNNQLVEFAKNVDLLLCEAGLLERDDKSLRAMHLTAKEAGEIAQKAGAKRLLLTHFLPDTKMEQYMNEARGTFEGILEVAGENKTYFI